MKDEIQWHLETIAEQLLVSMTQLEKWEDTRDKLAMVMRLAMKKTDVKKFEMENAKIELVNGEDLSVSYNPNDEAKREFLH